MYLNFAPIFCDSVPIVIFWVVSCSDSSMICLFAKGGNQIQLMRLLTMKNAYVSDVFFANMGQLVTPIRLIPIKWVLNVLGQRMVTLFGLFNGNTLPQRLMNIQA